jgi:predicted type IV restriction endonuclease
MSESWGALTQSVVGNEATVEVRFVLPLLGLLGYDQDDIAPKHPAIFQEGRRGRSHEADFAIFNGVSRTKESALLVVEAKKSGESLAQAQLQAESYTANLGTPFLLRTNRETVEIWQTQFGRDAEMVLRGRVIDILQIQSKLEALLRKDAVAFKKAYTRHTLSLGSGATSHHIPIQTLAEVRVEQKQRTAS